MYTPGIRIIKEVYSYTLGIRSIYRGYIVIPPVYEVYRGYIVFAFSVCECVCVCVNFFFRQRFLGNYLTQDFEIWYKHWV